MSITFRKWAEQTCVSFRSARPWLQGQRGTVRMCRRVLNTQPVGRADTTADPGVGQVYETSFLSPPSLPLYETWPSPLLLQLQ